MLKDAIDQALRLLRGDGAKARNDARSWRGGPVIGGLLTSTFITLVFVPTVKTRCFEEGWAGLWKKHPHQQATAH